MVREKTTKIVEAAKAKGASFSMDGVYMQVLLRVNHSKMVIFKSFPS